MADTNNYSIKKIKIFIIFFVVGSILYWIPNYGTFIQMRDVWLHELRVETKFNNELKKSLPQAYKEFGAAKNGFFQSNVDFYKITGRFHFFWLGFMDFITWIARGNAEIWRLINTILLAFTMLLFYLIASRFRIPGTLIILLSAMLMIFPVGVTNCWRFTITNEAPATIFFLLAVYLLLIKNNIKMNIISAILMVFAVLSKENFGLHWLVIVGIIIFKQKSQANSRKDLIFSTIKRLLPHLIGLLFILIFVVFLRTYSVQNQPHYLTISLVHSQGSIILFVVYSIIGLLSMFTTVQLINWESFRLYLPVLIFLVIPLLIFIIYNHSSLLLIIKKSIRGNQNIILIVAMTTAIILHIITNYSIFIPFLDYHVLPCNFLAAFIAGMLLANIYEEYIIPFISKYYLVSILCSLVIILFPYYGQFDRLICNLLIMIVIGIPLLLIIKNKRFVRSKTKLLLFTVIFLLTYHKIDFYLIDESLNNRIEQANLKKLIDDIVLKIPAKSVVKIILGNQELIEYAFNLQANTLLSHRYDLIYHVSTDNDEVLLKGSNYIRKEFDLFNKGINLNNLISPVYIIKINKSKLIAPHRNSLAGSMKLFLTNLVELFRLKYLGGAYKGLLYEYDFHQH